MRKLIGDTRVAMLGAAGGLFSMSVFLLVARIDAYYTYFASYAETSYGGYSKGVEDLWWIPICFWNVVLSIGASLLVHRYLPTLQKSSFMLADDWDYIFARVGPYGFFRCGYELPDVWEYSRVRACADFV